MKTMLVFLLNISPLLAKASTCNIAVTYFYKTGAQETKNYEISAKSKADCTKKSKLYRENSTPQVVLKKEVKIQWPSK